MFWVHLFFRPGKVVDMLDILLRREKFFHVIRH